MRVARFHAPGDIRLEDAPEPVTGPGDLTIRVRNCSTCGTDVKIFRFGHHHIVPPRVLGHEIAARWSRWAPRSPAGRSATGCR